MNKGQSGMSRKNRMRLIAAELPAGWFETSTLRETISAVGDHPVTCRQSIDSYVNEMLATKWILGPHGGQYTLSEPATKTGHLSIEVTPAILLPEVREKIIALLRGMEYVSIDEEEP